MIIFLLIIIILLSISAIALSSGSLLGAIIASAIITLVVMVNVLWYKTTQIRGKYGKVASYFAINIYNAIPSKFERINYMFNDKIYDAVFLCKIKSFDFKKRLEQLGKVGLLDFDEIFVKNENVITNVSYKNFTISEDKLMSIFASKQGLLIVLN